MRVLVLTNLYPNPWQPHRATFNRQQFAALARQHEVRVISPVAWTDQWTSRHSGPHERVILRDGMTIEHPRYIFPPKVLRSWHGRFYLRSVRSTFERQLDQFRPDVVLASWAYPDAWAAVELTRRANVPVVAKVHGSDVLLLDQNLARRQLTADALIAADAVITVSRQLASNVAPLGVDPTRITLVYNGVDTALFQPGSMVDARAQLNLPDESPHCPIVLFIGNLVPVKGLETLIDACSILRATGERFRCCLIGSGALQQTLSRQIGAAGLEQIVQLLGPRPLEQLPAWYRAASVFVLPSRSEGIPNVILEALACRTPVVASRVGGIPEILNESSMVTPGDAEAMARAISLAIANPRDSSSNSFRTVSWETSANNLANVLTTAVERRRRMAA